MSKYYIAEKTKGNLFRMVGPYDSYKKAEEDAEGSEACIVKACVKENQYGAPVAAYPWVDLDSMVDEEER